VANRRIGERVAFLEGDAEKLPFDDARFQLVLSSNALHYFHDTNAALQEMRRVISPNGNLVITDWCRDYLWMKLLNRVLPWTQHAHVHTFTTGELEQVLSRSGFRVVHKSRKKISWFWGLMTMHAKPV